MPEVETTITTDVDPSASNNNGNGQQQNGAPEIENPAGLLNTLDKLKGRIKETEAQNRQLQQQYEQASKVLGQYTPEQIRDMQQRVETYEQRKLEEQQEYAKIKQSWQEKEQTYQGQLKERDQKLVDLQITYELEKAFYNTGGKANVENKSGEATYFDLLKPIAQRYIVFEEGKIQVVDPADGAKMFTDQSKPYTLADLMAKLRTAGPTAELFQPTSNGAGGGMGPNSNGLRRGNQIDFEALNKLPPAERIRIARERNWA